jgi:hypothetical protein
MKERLFTPTWKKKINNNHQLREQLAVPSNQRIKVLSQYREDI